LDLAGARIRLAADIVKTSIAPTWSDVGKLAVNYFLAKDIAAFDRLQDRNRGAPGR
jgi:uncharacterized membrane protein